MQAVIMAAGESSRFWPLNYQHKTLFKIGGQPLIKFLIEEIKQAGIKDIVIVQNARKEIERELKDKSLKFVIQKKPTSTGDALLCAKKFITHDQFFLINAEQQNVRERLGLVLKEFQRSKNKLILAASPTKTPWLFGILKMKRGRIVDVVEKPPKGKEPSRLKIVGDYFLPREFFNYLKKVPSHPHSLIYAISLYAKEKPVGLVKTREETLSLKYPWHLFKIMEHKLSAPGFKKRIAKSARIGKNTVISGPVVIGQGTKIGPNTTISGPCFIGKNCDLGASNVLRGPLNLEDGVKTGAFMEIKESIVQAGTHFHSGYLGNSLIGRDGRFGTGFVVANRRLDRQNIFSRVKGEKIDTSLSSFGAVAGEKTKVGIKVATMPGVFIGSRCVIWPGVLVFKNVPDDTILKKNANRKN